MSNLHTLHQRPERSARIVGAASSWGAGDRGCEAGPAALQQHGLAPRLQARGTRISWDVTLEPAAGADESSATTVVAEFCRRLAREVTRVASAGDLAVVIGGDHSCAIGTWNALRDALRGSLGLIWVDAHLDAHTPETSPSGALHGMPLACLLGYGEPSLAQFSGAQPALLPAHVCVIGARDHEKEEAALLQRLGVRVFGMEEIARKGLGAVLFEALQIVQHGTAGFGITIDLDAIDPRDAPAVSTPAPGGIRGNELADALRLIQGNPRLAAIELAEFNPALDRDGRTARLATELLAALVTPLPAAIALTRRYCAHNYDAAPVVFVRGEGAWLWDERGNRYLDMLSAYSAVSHGHAHPRLLRALTEQAHKVAVFSRNFHSDKLGKLARRLCQLTGQKMMLPMNTGAEAVETAIKAARKWAYTVKGVPRDRAAIIACEGNFHGRTTTIVGLSSIARYKEGFGPFAPGCTRIPYGDAAALERAITPHTAAFLVEPLQGEGGIIVPPAGYLAECARICARHRVLLVCDEIQTGLGRTGKFLASEHEGVVPDGLTLGKALGGGLLPVSAFLASREVMRVFGPGEHGSTFGGNPLACAVALEALDVLRDEKLVERSAELGAYLLKELRRIESPLIREVRGKGLLIGMEIDPRVASAKAVCDRLLEHGVVTKETRETVLRFAPPLVVTRAQIDWALARIRAVLEDMGPAWHKAA